MNNKIVYISDFFLDHVAGGAELNDDELIKMLADRGYSVIKKQSHEVTVSQLDDHVDCFFIISNFVNLSSESKAALSKLEYLIYEHDHKYLKNRNPAFYENFVAPSAEVINYHFYKNAKAVICQSTFHKDIVEKNLKIKNIISVGGNLWPLGILGIMRDLLNSPKKERCSIMKSNIWHKNTQGAVKHCSDKEMAYDLIHSQDYKTFLSLLASNKKFVFLPKSPETLSRIVVEARMLGCSVISNALVGACREDWFSLKGEDLIDYMTSKRKEIVELIIKIINKQKDTEKRPLVSIITTFHDASKFIEGFMDNITNQTMFSDCELILIDAGSLSNEVEVIKKYKERHPNIRHIRLPENKPVTECVNMAIKISRADFLTLACVDDVKRTDCVQTLYDHIIDDVSVDLVYGDVICTDKSNDLFNNNRNNHNIFEHSKKTFSRENMIKCLPGPMPLWRKTIHEKNGFFDDKECDYADDWEMWLRCVSTGSKFKKVNEKVGLYYTGGRSTRHNNLKQREEEAKIFFKYRSVFGSNFELYRSYFSQFIRR